jgi:hypothetical protein
MTQEQLVKELNRVETLIQVYSERDWERVEELQNELRELNLKLLDVMMNEEELQ